MSEFALVTRGLSCGYRNKTVLREVGFSARAGEILALLGPNGSGKSTLLKTLARNIQPLDGEVMIQGRKMESYSDRDLALEISFVPQEEFAFFDFRVEEIVMMGRLPLSGLLFDSQEDANAVESALTRADCNDLRGRSVMELSGGEKQRVWIARALAQGAKIMLLDEPSSHLDVAHQVSLVKLLRELAASGLTILAAVHDLNLAAALGGRGLLLQHGSVAIDAPINQVLSDDLLESVYQIRFDRIRSDNGSVRVLPPFS